MKNVTTLGIPDTLPPLGIREVWNWLWLGFTGFLLLLISLFPKLVPFHGGGILVLVCWLALPARGLFSKSARKPRTDDQKRIAVQVNLYTLIVVSFGIGFAVWARQLGLPWRIVGGAIFLIEALPSVIVSLMEWWRLSVIGLSVGLMICGFGLPFVEKSRMFVLVGGAVFLGSLASAGILYWQVRRHESFSEF